MVCGVVVRVAGRDDGSQVRNLFSIPVAKLTLAFDGYVPSGRWYAKKLVQKVSDV